MSDSKTLLLVEDEAVIALSEKRILEKEGYQVLHVMNGEAAIETVCVRNQPVDLILMDINLGPSIDGPQTAQQILKSRDIPIIFLSSYTDKEVVEKTEKITSYGYVVKNSGPVVLDASIKMAFKLHAAYQTIQDANQKLELEIAEHQRTEEELRETQQLYENIFRLSPEVIALTTEEEGRYLAANAAHEHVTGYHSDEIIGHSVNEYGIWNSADQRKQMIQRLRTQGTIHNVETCFRRKDGEAFTALLSMARVEYGGQPCLISILNDITENKRAEESLRQSEARGKAMLWAIPDLMFRMNREGVYLDYKADTRDLYAQSVPTLIGRRNRDISPPAFASLIEQKIRDTLESGKLQTFEFQLPIPNRGMREYEARMVASGPDEVTAIVRDITERKQIETALRQSENNFATFFNSVDDLLFVSDLQGTILKANTTACLRLKYAAEELIGQPILALHAPERQAEAEQAMKEMLYGNRHECSIPLVDRDGGLIEVETTVAHGKWNGQDALFCVNKDASILKRSEEKFARAFNVNAATMAISKLSTGHFVDVNEAFCATLGYTREEALTKTMSEIFFKEEANAYQKIASELGKKGSLRNIEYSVRTRDGTQRTGLLSADPITLNGEPYLLAMFVDFTERKQAEDQIKALLKEKELLLKEVHHRIKNNMNTISSLLSLQADVYADETTQMALQDASGRVRSMMVLYDRLYRSHDFTAVSLDEYVPALLKEIVALFPQQTPVCIETQVEEIVLKPNILSALGIILNELTTNAIKYAFADNRKGIIRVKAERKSQRVVIIFEDNGVGLPDSFVINDSSNFGLQLVEMLVQQMRGTMSIDGKQGTRYVIEFNAN